MKAHFLPSITTALAVITLTATPNLRAQVGTPGQPGYGVEMITPTTQEYTVAGLANKPVRVSNQEQVATISEFLIDPHTGRVHFAVVNAGPKNFRLVPMNALQQGSGSSGLILALNRTQWDQLPTMSEQDLLGAVTLDAAAQQRFQQQFQLPFAEQPAQQLIRSTLMNEREVRIGNDVVGKVDDVVIDFHNRISAPVVKFKAPGTNDEKRALIHFAHLQVNAEPHSAITANLGPNELRTLGLPVPAMMPTGNTYVFPGQPPQNAATAVQQALDRDTSIARGAVQAIPETRIVLRGTVDSDQKRMDVERAAQQAAPGVPIENQLMVRR